MKPEVKAALREKIAGGLEDAFADGHNHCNEDYCDSYIDSDKRADQILAALQQPNEREITEIDKPGGKHEQK